MSHQIEKISRAVDSGKSNGKLDWLTVFGAAQNNLKNIDVRIPLARFVCVTGVSGSGKSSLVRDIIREQLMRDVNGAEKAIPGHHLRIDGKQHLDKVIDIDQSPIGRTPRSNPATYIKLFDEIRDLYARLPDSRVRGYKPGRFSFNVPTGKRGGGRCEACEGNGSNRIEMDFLADVWVTCAVCGARRFNHETLQILYKGKSITDVLDMDVQDALLHFDLVPKIRTMLQTLHDVGLDYLKLGQPSTTLSGGEAQRIKLARQLVKRARERTLYILDEPTTGLHFDDIKKLLAVLHGFVDAGHSVLVIEHNLDVIKTADWVIDLGPEGGAGGGRIVAEGTPEDVARCKRSHTGEALRAVLDLEQPKSNGKRRANGARPRGRGSKKGEFIHIAGARQHNLKNITVDIPLMKTTVFSGLSGSGKSSLAMDTLYAEGQRRYVESLSAYARQFLGQLQKPKVDHITGLPPAIAIEQKQAGHSPRSTVGTVTEIYDYLRILYARLGRPYCPKCDLPIGTQSSEEIVDCIMDLPGGTRFLLLAPIERSGSEKYADLFAREKKNGYARVRVDDVIYALDDDIPVKQRARHTVELVVDRLIVKAAQRSRIADSVEQTLTVGNGVAIVQPVSESPKPSSSARASTNQDRRFSQLFACNNCGNSYDELTPHHFSFNNRLGWCQTCEGLGTQQGAGVDTIVADPNRSILEGAIKGWNCLDDNDLLRKMIRAVADHIGFNPHNAWRDLSPHQQHMVLHGLDQDEWVEIDPPSRKSSKLRVQWKGFYPAIDQATKASWHYRKKLENLVTEIRCKACRGARLKPLPARVRFGDDSRSLTIHELCALPLDEALGFCKRLKLDAHAKRIAGELMHEITSRLQFLVDVGLDYVTLSRAAPTLSGGESQRIRLASQLGSGLTGVLYVLDEPTIGLHPRDNRRLIGALEKLRDLGNTLCIVEHDRDVIDHADGVLDFGPGAGREGGEIVAHKSPSAIRRDSKSLTGKYLSEREAIAIPMKRRKVGLGKSDSCILVYGARHNNLKDIDVTFPLGAFIAVTGVSGSGKSSLVNDILYNAMASRIHRARLTPAGHDEITGLENVDKVINVDQSPIGRSPSSNAATYTKVFDVIRELFARLPESKVRGYSANRFSFNRAGGRCEECSGFGQICIEMHFLPDVWITCEECGGKRYNAETLQVQYRGKSVADVLDMRVADAVEHFKNVPKVCAILRTLMDVGLGYVQLGQSAPTLSGGEAQRVKLAAELSRPSTGKTVYVLDEPTTGLHFHDLSKLLDVLHRFVDLGNTVICIEHNLDLIKTADWIIDLGPEGGDAGGELIAAGTPEEVAKHKRSHTGKILAKVLAQGRREDRKIHTLEDAAKRQAQIDSRLVLSEDDVDIKLPWEKNGRKWHTEQCLAPDSERPDWEPKALIWLIEQMERSGKFEPVNWNHRSRIEIKAPRSKNAWFCHILTRGKWLLECTFRVPKRSFDGKKLAAQLCLKTLDEREELPVYGGRQRVKRKVGRDFDDIRIWIHDLAEIKTPAFRDFLDSAIAGHAEKIGDWRADPAEAEPWKTDGRKWHLSQKSIRTNRRRSWKPTVLLDMVGRINKAVPNLDLDWNNKTAVVIKHPKLNKPWAKITTSNRYGLKLEIKCRPRLFTPLKIDRLGLSPEIKRNHNYDILTFWVQELDQVDLRQLSSVLREAEKSLVGQ